MTAGGHDPLVTRFLGVTIAAQEGHWPDGQGFLKKSLEERYDAQRDPIESRTHWAAFARYRDKWKIYWHPLELLDIQRDYR